MLLSFRYVAPSWITFNTSWFQADFLELAESIEYQLAPNTYKVVAPVEFRNKVEVAGKLYKLGVGGIHSFGDQGSYYSNEGVTIKNVDVGSFYPNIILEGGFHPSHIQKEVWLTMYRNLTARRMDAKVRLKEVYTPFLHDNILPILFPYIFPYKGW